MSVRKMYSFRVEEALLDEIVDYSKNINKSTSFVIRRALYKYLDDLLEEHTKNSVFFL